MDWLTIDTVPPIEAHGQRPAQVLLYSPSFGIRTGEAGNFRGHLFGYVSNLGGCAVEDWGATHWMPLPEKPRTETAQERPTSTETNVNEQRTEGDSGMNRQG